eukprot:Rmarinus@m.5908
MRGGVHVYRLEDDELVHVPELLRDLYDQLRCAVCHYIGRSWTMLPCEHYYCNQCVAGLLKKKAITCPECQRTYGKGSLKAARIVEKLAAKLPVWCKAPGWENGCQWQGVLDMREEHVAQCDFHPVTCPHEGCEEQAMRKDVEGHAKECDFRAVKCCHEGCSVEFQHRLGVDRRNHERMCPKRIVNCPSCGLPCAIELSSAHAKLCPKLVVSCDEECGDVVKEESNSVDGDANPRSKAPSCPQPPGSPKQANNLVPRADPISAGDASEAGSLAGSSVADLSPALPPATDPACEPNAANGAVAKKKKKKSKRSRKGKRAAGHADSAAQCLDASCDDDATSSTTETFNTPSLDPTVVDAGAPSTGSDPLTMPLTPVQSYLNTVYGVEPPVPDFGTHVHAGGESSSPLSAPEASGRHQSVLAAASAFAASVARAEDGSRSGPEVGTGGTETPLFSKLGLSLHVLEEFIMRQCGGRESLEGLTTRDVFQRYMKPFTQNSQTSYCEILKKEGHPGIREATVYVSHAWDDLFLEVVDALTQHVKERPSEESDEESNESSDDVVLWFDLFSLNQHDKVAITVEWLKEALHAAIPEFRENVLVLTASGNCRPLRRTWCLYEVFCMGDNNFWVARWGDVKIPLNLDVDCLWGWYSTFPFELSDCSSAEEKARIIDAVRESHSSCERVDVRVTSLLIMDLRKHTKDEDAKLMMSSKYYIINLQHSLAADLAKLIVEARRKTLSPTHPDVLSAESFHGCIVCHVDVPQAVSMLSKTLEKQRNILGSDNKDTILTAVRLGVALSRDKKEKEAIELLLNTPSSPALYVLAEVYTARGKIEEAIAAGEKALAGFVSELGEHNFATYATMVALGRKYLQAEQLDDAVRLLQAAWEGFGQLVGRDYMISLSACLHLASALSKQGEDSKAIPLFEEALLKHSMSARFAGNDAVMPFEDSLLRSYITASQSEDAAKFGNFLLENRKKALGVEHTDTMNISMLLSCIQRFVDERLPLTEEAFRDIQKALGITHPRTVNAVFHLGQHLRSQRKFETAAKILKEVLDANRSPSEEPSVIIMLLNDLAMHYGEMRKIADATKALEEAWDIQGRIPLLPIATRLLLTLAFFYAAAGEPKRGSDLIANALGAHEQELAKDHAAYLQLQATLYALSEGRDYGSVHRWRASMFDEMDPDPWKCMFSLVWEDVSKRWCRGVVGTDDVWADDPGKSKHVTAVLEKIAQKKESVDNSDLEYLSLLKLAVVFLTDLSRHTEAEPLARELLTKQRVAAGADSEDAVEATILLASVCSLAGKAKDAVELYEGALLKAKKSQGPSALSLSIDALLGLAEHYRSQRQLEESRRLLATFLKRKTKQLGLAHMHILNVKFRLASILYEVGKYQLAVTSVRDVALTLGSTVGTDTVPAMQARFLLAQFLWASAQYVPSKPLFEEAITLWPDVYGSEHPLTRRVTQRVQDLRKKNEPLLVLVSSAEARDAGASSSSSSSVVASVAGATPVIVRRARRRKK